jgi:cell division septation protein DedD
VKNDGVVLDRTGLIQLVGGTSLLLVFCFTAGAVVGFAVHGDMSAIPGPVDAGGAAATQASLSDACVPAPEAAALQRSASADVASPPAVELVTPPVQVAEEPAAAVAELPAPDTQEAAEPPSGKWAVQLGVFGVAANADRLAADLRRRGYEPRVAATRGRAGRWMQRVSLAVYDSEEDAQLAARDFQTREGLPAVVVAFREDER